jgi:long-chain acyl-CoA synthetase
MTIRDEIIAKMTAPGAPFELQTIAIDGVPLRVFANAPESMREIIAATADSSDRPYLMYHEEVITYGEALEKIASIAQWLIDRGVKKGDRVAIGMRNYPEWPLAYWAIISVGAISVSLNAWWIAEELEYAIADSSCKVLFVDGERQDRLSDDLLKRLSVTDVVVARSTPRKGFPSFDDVALHPSHGVPIISVDPDDDCTILYTSGTTGFPKGAVGTHRNHITNILNTLLVGSVSTEMALAAGVEPKPATQPVSLWTFPFFHIAGVTGINVAAATRGALLSMYKWDADEALRLIERHRVTTLAGVPTVVRSLLEHPHAASFDLSSLATISQGGSPVPPDSIKKIEGDFERRVNPTNGYGLTETTSAIISNSGLSYFAKNDSVGLPMVGADVRIVDEDGNDLSIGEVGELWVRSPNNVRGYWNKPEETAKAFINGWFRSGDAARIDEDGFVYVVDRIKDMVLRGGENVYCAEVEAVLFEHDSVEDVAVIGIPHASLGEEVAAVIVPKAGYGESDTASVQEFAARRLATFKVPVKLFWQTDPLPRNATGKVLKKELRDTYSNM